MHRLVFSLLAPAVMAAAIGCDKKYDVHASEVWDLDLAEDDGVPAIAWMRMESSCHGSTSATACSPNWSDEYVPEGWAIYAQIDESEPLSWLPEPTIWQGWHPNMKFDVAAGHTWQLVWGGYQNIYALWTTFLVHDGVATNLDVLIEEQKIQPSVDSQLLARDDDTAILVTFDDLDNLDVLAEEVRVLQIDANAQILSDRRVTELEANYDVGYAWSARATLVGDELLLGLSTRKNSQFNTTVVIYRGLVDGFGEVVDTGIDGKIVGLWGDSVRSRVMILQDNSQIEPTVFVVDVGQDSQILAPDTGSACDDPTVCDFLANGDAVCVFAGESCPGLLVVPETDAPWVWDVGSDSTVHSALGSTEGLWVYLAESHDTTPRGALVLLDVAAREAVPLFDLDFTPGGRLSEQAP